MTKKINNEKEAKAQCRRLAAVYIKLFELNPEFEQVLGEILYDVIDTNVKVMFDIAAGKYEDVRKEYAELRLTGRNETRKNKSGRGGGS